ncbi:MAG TPA: SUMF1/EgtB/PvdO family nonheme iron enzyme [Pirellulales bacterium]|jgi:formylglycine-generating enzyme required for sulfatase activity|nr:SUMF1/EgtB/PvdO family nonheme iron enzyme [Pirellulales bacterium]
MCWRWRLRGIFLPWVLFGYLALVFVAGPSILFGAEGEEERTPQKWALLIGVDAYKNLPSLKYSCPDQRDLGAQLIKGGFDAKQVFVMHDKARKSLRPSKANVERQLELLLDPTKGLVQQGDLVIVGFSGHGTSLEGKSYLCPTDASEDDPPGTMIALESVYRYLNRSRAEQKLLMVDACHTDPAGGPGGILMARGFAVSLRSPPKGLMVLSSCGEGQKAFDDAAGGHGIFMRFLVDGLAGKAARADGQVTLMGLYSYAGSLTRRYVNKRFKALQIPLLEGRTEGNFELCRIEREPPSDETTAPAKEEKPAPVAGEVITNTIGMKLALIPAGEFLMGSPESELSYGNEHEASEQQHQVRITRPFYMGVHEVTQSQYQAVMGKNPSRFSSVGPLKDELKGLNTSKFPVEHVSYDDALEFCRRLSEKEGKLYRLPTEAEWEYACRGGTISPFSFGDSCNGSEANCNGERPYGTKIKGKNLERPTTVGSFRPNAFGLYDMHGNVWERCSDWFDGRYYGESPLEDPEGPATGGYHVSRGGGWLNDAVGCRSAVRYGNVPSYRESDLGLRVCIIP